MEKKVPEGNSKEQDQIPEASEDKILVGTMMYLKNSKVAVLKHENSSEDDK